MWRGASPLLAASGQLAESSSLRRNVPARLHLLAALKAVRNAGENRWQASWSPAMHRVTFILDRCGNGEIGRRARLRAWW